MVWTEVNVCGWVAVLHGVDWSQCLWLSYSFAWCGLKSVSVLSCCFVWCGLKSMSVVELLFCMVWTEVSVPGWVAVLHGVDWSQCPFLSRCFACCGLKSLSVVELLFCVVWTEVSIRFKLLFCVVWTKVSVHGWVAVLHGVDWSQCPWLSCCFACCGLKSLSVVELLFCMVWTEVSIRFKLLFCVVWTKVSVRGWVAVLRGVDWSHCPWLSCCFAWCGLKSMSVVELLFCNVWTEVIVRVELLFCMVWTAQLLARLSTAMKQVEYQTAISMDDSILIVIMMMVAKPKNDNKRNNNTSYQHHHHHRHYHNFRHGNEDDNDDGDYEHDGNSRGKKAIQNK